MAVAMSLDKEKKEKGLTVLQRKTTTDVEEEGEDDRYLT